MTTTYPKCPICRICNEPQIPIDGFYKIKCQICGTFLISDEALEDISSLIDLKKKHIISGVIRELHEKRTTVKITSGSIKNLETCVSVPDGPIEAIDKILQYIHSKTNMDQFEELKTVDYSIAYVKNYEEFKFVLGLASNELNYLEGKSLFSLDEPTLFRLTLKGWKQLEKLKKIQPDSNQAFVAMWFDKEMDNAWKDGFYPALKEVGYNNPTRIDLVQHNEKICDRIIAEIRKSGLVVADFTGNRSGVFFEAGFALGLGITVIWTCRKDKRNELERHFDTRQYNHILWKDPEDLRKQLIDRIESTITNRPRL